MKKTCISLFVAVIPCVSAFPQTEPNLINPTGNVGIGTTDPGSVKLNVRGSVKIDSTLTVYDSLVVVNDGRFRKKLTVDQKVLMKKDAVVGEDLKVQGNTVLQGNLKLPGLVVPANLSNKDILFVNDNGLVQKSGFPFMAAQLYSLSCLQLPDGVTMNPVWSNGPSKIFTACPEDVRVGIGTDAPRSRLDVRGTTFTQNLAIGIHPDNMTGRFHLKSALGEGNASTVFLVENQQQKILELNNQGLLTAEKILVKNTAASGSEYVLQVENANGKLLQLQSNGLLRLRKIRVDTETWADFVFDDNYRLMPAEALRTFIEIHRHLPGVPAAATVKAEGIDLAEMNKILLQKVEELTLYMLEQQELMKQQQQQINELIQKTN